jgi:ubiquinone/menaquinone biosynthesis C-methylase UbiE
MVKPRVPETEDGIQGEFDVRTYDKFMRGMRDRGWMETNEIIRAGITSGLALELGPGPGYLGLEWLKKTTGTYLKGLDISENMIEIATQNAREYGFMDRVEYVRGDACEMPFEDAFFDAVFSNGSLHEWARPDEIINEIGRVLKPGGRYCITDMKRNMSPFVKSFLWIMAKPRNIRPYLVSSINAAYTKDEIEELLSGTKISGWQIDENPIGLTISGRKTTSL